MPILLGSRTGDLHQRRCSPFDRFGQLPIAIQLCELETKRWLPPVLTGSLVLFPRIVASAEGEQHCGQTVALKTPDLTVPVEGRESFLRWPIEIDECARVGDLSPTSRTRRERHFVVHL
jgi:hypothetical protein